MKIHPPSSSKSARIEIIPLIDVIFFLLATFVLISLSLQRQLVFPTLLPPNAGPAPKHSGQDEMVQLRVQAGRNYAWNDLLLADQAALQAMLRQYQAGCPNPRVLITGDTEASFGSVFEVLDLARQCGFTPQEATFSTKSH